MIPALLIGRGGSCGVPGKNTMPILGRPLMTYPILAAKNSRHVDRIYLSTEATDIQAIGREHGLEIIDRPRELSTDQALVEDVVVHGFHAMRECGADVEMFVLLFCNTATITPGIIDRGIEALRADASFDSAVTVSPYNEFSPVRAKRVTPEGTIMPYVDVNAIANASCDRDSAETCYFCDCSVWILRSQCMQLENGILPFRWMGRRSMPLYQTGGLDIDHDYGIAMTDHWLRARGFSENRTPYDPQ
ncbi:MAG: cytidylyltransferase [Bryobacteraceae bacterium]|jgi:CMP-N-acetylneuraminic acid synthetase